MFGCAMAGGSAGGRMMVAMMVVVVVVVVGFSMGLAVVFINSPGPQLSGPRGSVSAVSIIPYSIVLHH